MVRIGPSRVRSYIPGPVQSWSFSRYLSPNFRSEKIASISNSRLIFSDRISDEIYHENLPTLNWTRYRPIRTLVPVEEGKGVDVGMG